MTSETENPTLAAIATLILLMPFDIALNGWVLMTAWGWFVAPVFGVALTLGQAAGLTTFKVIVAPAKAKDAPTVAKVLGVILSSWIASLLMLGIGAIVHAVIS